MQNSTATDLLLNNRTWESQGQNKFNANVLAAAGLKLNTAANTLRVSSENLVLPRRQYLPRSSRNFTKTGLSFILPLVIETATGRRQSGMLLYFLTASSTVCSSTERDYMRFLKNRNTVLNIWRLRLAVSYCSIVKDRLALVTHKKVLLCSLVIDFCSKGSIRWVRGHIVSITPKFTNSNELRRNFKELGFRFYTLASHC